MPKGHTARITDPTHETRHHPARVLAGLRAFSWASDLRDFTPDELTVFNAAREAGASFPGLYVAEYLRGERPCPFQFEGCWLGAEWEDWAIPAVETAIAKRDGFFDRVQSGDLRGVAERVFGVARREAA